jgi:hypothetical protein
MNGKFNKFRIHWRFYFREENESQLKRSAHDRSLYRHQCPMIIVYSMSLGTDHPKELDYMAN